MIAALLGWAAPVREDPCRCGHVFELHTHWRPGSDCGACGSRLCAVFRPREWVQ